MSISTTATKVSYSGNNSNSTPYAITFKYLDVSHVTVYADKVDITTNCTFSGDGAAGTGQFTTDAAQAPTVTVTAVLDVPFDQPVVLQETGSLPAKTLEVSGFDRLNMQIRRVWRKATDALSFSSDEGSGSTGTADTLVGFDGSGDIEEVAKSTFVQTANNLSDVDAATARTNLNVDVAGTDNSTDVTTSGAGTYVTMGAGQVLTVDPIEGTEIVATGETLGTKFLRENGDGSCSWIDLSGLGLGDALTSNPLSQFATTTSAQLAGVISDKTGTGKLVFENSPTLITPNLGTPSAIDLTNATNTPLPSAGTVTDAMLEANLVGTTQGEGATTYNIQPKDEGTVAGNARGENSVDLQTNRANATEVASGLGAILIGGDNNTASNTNSAVVGGSGNSNSGANTTILGGQNNSASSFRGVVLGGRDNVASAGEVLVAGEAGTASHTGARVFADGTATAFGSITAQEFAIQGSALRLVDGNESAGKVLTCDANGSGNWADPEWADPARVHYSKTHSTVSGTIIQNTSGRPLLVSFTLLSTTSIDMLLLDVSPNSDMSSYDRVSQFRADNSGSGYGDGAHVIGVVPAGWYWEVEYVATSPAELKHTSFLL